MVVVVCGGGRFGGCGCGSVGPNEQHTVQKTNPSETNRLIKPRRQKETSDNNGKSQKPQLRPLFLQCSTESSAYAKTYGKHSGNVLCKCLRPGGGTRYDVIKSLKLGVWTCVRSHVEVKACGSERAAAQKDWGLETRVPPKDSRRIRCPVCPSTTLIGIRTQTAEQPCGPLIFASATMTCWACSKSYGIAENTHPLMLQAVGATCQTSGCPRPS